MCSTERDRFVAAFNAILARDEKPTPGALNREQGFDVRRAIPGRLTGLRIEMLLAAGYKLDDPVKGVGARYVKS